MIETREFIVLENGVTYSEAQIRKMFTSQIESIKDKVKGDHKKLLNQWMS